MERDKGEKGRGDVDSYLTSSRRLACWPHSVKLGAAVEIGESTVVTFEPRFGIRGSKVTTRQALLLTRYPPAMKRLPHYVQTQWGEAAYSLSIIK